MPVNLAPSSVPYGRLARSTTTASTGSIVGTEVTVTGLTTAFVVSEPGTRSVNLTVRLRIATTIAPSTADVYVDVTNTDTSVTTRIDGDSVPIALASGAGATSITMTAVAELDPGNYSASVKVKRTSGTGTLSVAQAAGGKQSLTVSDDGAV